MHKEYKLYFGGWYQRTTLHLSEIYDLFAKGYSKLPLNESKLAEFREKLGFKKVTRETDYLEYVLCETANGISLRYYEDGLYVLSKESKNFESDMEQLSEYYSQKVMPAVNYIFSLGAPTPKILANIQDQHPFVVVGKGFAEKNLSDVYSEIDSDLVKVKKTHKLLFFDYKEKNDTRILSLVETQIFFREFKDQLEKYLNIHRTIWEKVTKLKEGTIRGKDVIKVRLQMESYERTVSLINNRINQMASYIRTRQSIAKEYKIEEHLLKIFDYKFDTLTNTHSYIKEIWAMTSDYIKNIIRSLSDIETQKLNNSVKSLQILTSIGVVSGAFGYLTRNDFPKFTNIGIAYFGFLLLISLFINFLISFIYRQVNFKLKIPDTSKI